MSAKLLLPPMLLCRTRYSFSFPLEDQFLSHVTSVVSFEGQIAFDSLRSDQRFGDLVRRLGLTPSGKAD